MTQPIAAVVKVAATPAQAKILAALLQAEGIPATIDGDSLADEVAVSRRMLNLNGTRVMVPTSSLERAREILAAAQVDEAELEAQALAADSPEREEPVVRSNPPSARRRVWPLFVTTAAAVTFLALWLSEVNARTSAERDGFRLEATDKGMREIRIRDGATMWEWSFEDGVETHVAFAENGQQAISTDANRDHRFESFDEHRKQGVVCAWSDTDNDGLMDLCVVKDAIGVELQRLRWVDGKGFEPEAR